MTQELLSKDDDIDLPIVDPSKDYLKELVGEGKKFKTPEDLAKGKFEADQMVEILKRRSDEFREEYLKERQRNTTQDKLEEVPKQLTKKQIEGKLPEADETNNQSKFDPKQLESLVSNQIREYEMTRQQTSNFNMVKDKLQQRYGTNYKTAVQKQIDELGINAEELDHMARKQPKVLLRTLGLDKEPETNLFQSPPRNQQRSDSFAPTGSQKRTWSYYQNLKKTNKDLYLDRNTAIQMQRDAIELGDAFRDGDYYVRGLHE